MVVCSVLSVRIAVMFLYSICWKGKTMNLNDNPEGSLVLTKEIETKGKYLTVEVRIGEKYGFVDVVITDNATGKSIDLDIQLTEVKEQFQPDAIEAVLTTNDKVIGTLTNDGIDYSAGLHLKEKS